MTLAESRPSIPHASAPFPRPPPQPFAIQAVCRLFKVEPQAILSSTRGGVVACYARQVYATLLHVDLGMTIRATCAAMGRESKTVRYACSAIAGDREDLDLDAAIVALANMAKLKALHEGKLSAMTEALAALLASKTGRRSRAHMVEAMAAAGAALRDYERENPEASIIPFPGADMTPELSPLPKKGVNPWTDCLYPALDAAQDYFANLGASHEYRPGQAPLRGPTRLQEAGNAAGEVFHKGARERVRQGGLAIAKLMRLFGFELDGMDIDKLGDEWRARLCFAG
jgi:hypothetical protein